MDVARLMPMYQVATDIFREYDIRGQYPLKLNEKTAQLIGQALGSEVLQAGQTQCYVAWDGRLSSPSLKDALIAGICATGCNVHVIGPSPTAAAFFSIKQSGQSCAVVTGSHNPKQDNGIKIAVAGQARSGDDIQVLLSRIQLGLFDQGKGRIHDASELYQSYEDALVKDIEFKRPLKVVLDAGNGIGGPTAVKALKRLGAEVIEIACDVNGEFPLHHPDPAKTKNLKWLQESVLKSQADLGLALDGDADRIGVVDDKGRAILPDRLSLLFVEEILQRQPKATCVFDVKCTSVLAQHIKQLGGVAKMIATGHTSMKRTVKETGAPFATELSGHILFNDQHGLGVDDGIYAGLRLCQLISRQSQALSERLDTFPNPVSTEEIQLPVSDHKKFSIMKLIQSHGFKQYECNKIDGIRIQFDHGWALVRASNTTPCLTLRFEAENLSRLMSIQQLVSEELHRIVPTLPNAMTLIEQQH